MRTQKHTITGSNQLERHKKLPKQVLPIEHNKFV